MPRRIPTIRIVPEVLAWARESAGLSQEELSQKIRSGDVNIYEWERPGAAALVTPGQIENIADAVKRPTAALLLHAPPKEARSPKDFRRSHRRRKRYSPDLFRAIRRARRLQRIAAEIFRDLEEHTAPNLPATFNMTDDTDRAAVQVRRALDIPEDIHTRWGNVGTALRAWRSIVESRNVLVFSWDFPRDEAQGFSLSDAQPNAIMLSANDSPSARCFTLWHEFGHLLLRNTGLCLTDEPEDDGSDADRRTEDWCNRFAEAMLVDGEMLRSRQQAAAVAGRRSGYEADLLGLANHFKVSQNVVLFRMRHLGILPIDQFRSEYNRLREEQTRRSRPKRGGGRNIPNEVVRYGGQRLVRGVLQAFDRGTLTRADIADYFGARLKHLDNIRREANR